jgi:hypothetical protein
MKDKIINKKPLTVAAIVLAAVAVLAGALALILSSCGGPNTYTGYLICQSCGMQGKCSANNIDLTAHPEQFTLKCAKMADCILSGYGIAIKQENGKYKYFAFDTNGSVLALDNVIYQTKRADNLLVEVKGKMENNIIIVNSVKEK